MKHLPNICIWAFIALFAYAVIYTAGVEYRGIYLYDYPIDMGTIRVSGPLLFLLIPAYYWAKSSVWK